MNIRKLKQRLFRLKHRLSLKAVLAGSLALIIVGYAGYETKNLIRGPALVIDTPRAGTLVTEQLITITGRAERIAKAFLNQRQIFTDEAGRFEEKLLLAKGYNIIRLDAKDKFGRTVSTTVELIYQDNESPINQG